MKTIDITPLKDWLTFDKNLLIAGPCSAETEEQVMQTAREIAAIYPNAIFRAGVWKPRTRPNAFEGVGEPALEWLKKVKQETGMRIATEVANAEHTELALKNGVDIIWIGARTTVNPFSVQEIAEVVKDVDIPVFIKNPIHPDLQLWLGAIERIAGAGITKLAAIHRGFHSYDPSMYRNNPNWNLVIEMKRLLPNLPMICDPSHIAGNTNLLQQISQRAMDMAMDGLMLETHRNPTEAWSDAKQQVTPNGLKEILDSLVLTSANSDNEEVENKLSELRLHINKIDQDLLVLLRERFNRVEEIGEYKKQNGVSVLQIVRWDEILQKRIEQSSQLGINEEFVKKIYGLIHHESVRLQSAILA